MAHYVIDTFVGDEVAQRELIALDGRDIVMAHSHRLPNGIYSVEVQTQASAPEVIFSGSQRVAFLFIQWLMQRMEVCVRENRAFIYANEVPESIIKEQYKEVTYGGLPGDL